ncbi:MAG: phosphatase PAP2 family protein [Dehalococcoidia bacterium]
MSDLSLPSRARSAWSRFVGLFSRRDLVEALIVGLGFLLYFAVRGAVIDRPEVAYRHALDVIDAQRWLGIFWEDDMNEWIQERRFWAQTANIVYFWLHFPLIIAFGIYLYYGQRRKYTLMRDAFLASGAIALVIYWLYPVAPPRVLPELAAEFDNGGPVYIQGFFDTMLEYLGYGYQAQSTKAFVNPYAAMPSLHFGWDLLLGIGIVWASWKQPWMWITLPIGVFLPLSQIPAISATANHFFLDAAAGGVVALAGLGVAFALRRWAYPPMIEAMERSPWPALRGWLPADTGEASEPGAEAEAGLSRG